MRGQESVKDDSVVDCVSLFFLCISSLTFDHKF